MSQFIVHSGLRATLHVHVSAELPVEYAYIVFEIRLFSGDVVALEEDEG